MKKQTIISGLTAVLLAATACSSPANNASTTSTTTTSTATTNSRPNTPANSNNAAPANTNQAAAPADSAAAQTGKQDFTLDNATGVEIHKVYISPHDSDDWEEDILGRDTLPSGQTVDIKFHRNEKAAMWDLRVEDKDGNSIEWENLNLLEISKVTLHYKDGKAWADTE